VTHDQEEAMTMSNRIAVMRAGRIHQIGPPRQLYEYPNSRFVADFIGTANLLAGEVTSAVDGLVRVRLAGTGGSVETETGNEPMPRHGEAVTVMVRPEKLDARRAPAGGPNELSGEIVNIAYLGDLSIYHVKIADGVRVQAAVANRQHRSAPPLAQGETAYLSWHPGDAVILTA